MSDPAPGPAESAAAGRSRQGTAPDAPGGGAGATQPLPVIGPGAPREHDTGEPMKTVLHPPGRAGRFWSPRRIPAGITALLVLAGTGLLLYDVSAVRAGRHAMPWRTRLAHELAHRPLDDTWVLAGAAVALVLGLWLLLLALTPGLRQVLALRPGPGQVRAGLDRRAAALVLRDRAQEVPGVRTVRVAVGRRRARVRVESHFRELDDVREDLDEVLGEARRGFALQHRLRLSVSVRRADRE
jgi:Family of unknown function (DUF6286)